MADSLTTTARRIATEAHLGQMDKAGQPYIGHPERVAARLSGDELAEVAAWLPTCSKTSPTAAADLAGQAVPADVIATVQALTRTDDEAPDDYYSASQPIRLRSR